MSENRYVKIAVPLPVEGTFDYLVPDRLQEAVKIGQRVWISFGRRKKMIGYVVGLSASSEIKKVKEITSIVDEEPIADEDIIALCGWMAQYYFCSWGEAIEAVVPAGLKKGRLSMTSRVKEYPDEELLPQTELIPNPGQKAVLKTILEAVGHSKFQVFLLHGITASGKTEVYLQTIARVVEQGKSAIYLVPEIALTPQAVERFKGRFGENVSVLHSHLTQGQRYQQWEKIKKGESRVIVGARSAIFAPVRKLGLVIVDEEHENTYKQDDVPRYHARETGIMRALQCGAVVILGSATPSLESFYNVTIKKYTLLELSSRVDNRILPEVKIIDMRRELFRQKRQAVLSQELEDEINRCLEKKEQVILFLNRRGFSTYCFCRKCGYVARCKQCSIALTYHAHGQELVCHYCGYRTSVSVICPNCRGQYIGYLGLGTQKVESELHRLFPQARIERMDTDAVSKRGSHHRILSAFKKREIDIIIGTQMIAKGLDFPNVTLAGVINADITLNFPDFRSGERTFQLLTQVAGRSGRGLVPGKVIIQTYTPDNYAISASSRYNYEDFVKQELAFRKELGYPPYLRLINIVARSQKEDRVIKTAQELSRQIKDSLSIIGPAPMPLTKLRGMFRWGLTIKTTDVFAANNFLRQIMKNFVTPAGVKIKIDVDPQMMV